MSPCVNWPGIRTWLNLLVAIRNPSVGMGIDGVTGLVRSTSFYGF